MTERFALTDVVKSWDDAHRERTKTCPGCGEDCSTVGIPMLVYTFEACGCDAVDYDHLIEQVWHGVCLVQSQVKAAGWTADVLAKAWLEFTYQNRQRWNGYRRSQWDKAQAFAEQAARVLGIAS